MSIEYDIYLKKHIDCVMHACSWVLNYIDSSKINDILPNIRTDIVFENIKRHDSSKYSEQEYAAYNDYFYKEKTAEIKNNFNYAWLNHIHHNPHHWQYWILIDDDGSFDFSNGNKLKALDMPDEYIFEMICDWWSFSWVKHLEAHKDISYTELDPTFGLYEIFDWYEDHKTKMILNDKTREKVEKILDLIRDKLDEIKIEQ